MDLGKQVGPFSVGAWLGIGAAGVGLGVLLRRSSLFGTGSSKSKATAPADAGPTYAYAPPGSTVPLVPTTPTPASSGGPKAPTDNREWQSLALEYLIAAGQDPAICQQALQRFLMGDALNSQQAAAVSMALRAFGNPPDGAPAMVLAPPSPATPPEAPTNRGIEPFQASRDRQRLNALRGWYAFVGGDVSDWPIIATTGAMAAPDARAAIAAFVRRENDARKQDPTARPTMTPRPQLPSDGTYTADVQAAAIGVADFFKLQY